MPNAGLLFRSPRSRRTECMSQQQNPFRTSRRNGLERKSMNSLKPAKHRLPRCRTGRELTPEFSCTNSAGSERSRYSPSNEATALYTQYRSASKGKSNSPLGTFVARALGSQIRIATVVRQVGKRCCAAAAGIYQDEFACDTVTGSATRTPWHSARRCLPASQR